MKYKLIFLILLIPFITFISIFVRAIDLYVTLLLIAFLIGYELFRPYFSKRTQEKLEVIVYLGIIIFIIIVFKKVMEILG
ncbi:MULTISPECIES: hypothetical protein [Methanothermococcus]|uniref:hypothetical protein n=1 Tax=Methanothermococcus TaxID=155862 RepID=UPI00037DDB8E|nr:MULTISPECIES: hypothetical protein [Methanothermococcus]